MLIYVKNANYIEAYQIKIEFTDGVTKTVDLKNHLTGEIFKPLHDINRFKDFQINKDTETIEWENGADFAPEFLYTL